ncbi:MAG: hypothetical protein ACE5JI_18065, partial [Acidobacteriota bacterium]
LFAHLTTAGAGKRRLLNRSIYVPIAFKACPHVTNAVLYTGETPLGRLPTERVFQFTYYPALKRLAPEVTQIRLEGQRDNGEPFVGRLAVAPDGVYTAQRHIVLDLKKQLEKLRHKIDIRFEKIHLLIRCHPSCTAGTMVAVARAQKSASR